MCILKLGYSFVGLNHFQSAFVNETSSNVSEKIVVRKSLAPKAEAKKPGSAENDEDKTPRPPISAGRASWILEMVMNKKHQMQCIFAVSENVELP